MGNVPFLAKIGALRNVYSGDIALGARQLWCVARAESALPSVSSPTAP
jgi:hypothetical protein